MHGRNDCRVGGFLRPRLLKLAKSRLWCPGQGAEVVQGPRCKQDDDIWAEAVQILKKTGYQKISQTIGLVSLLGFRFEGLRFRVYRLGYMV